MKKPVKPLEELLDSVREIEGYPIGEDEDLLALSDPPYYTACPNPYINDFIEEYGKPYDEESDNYHRQPFVRDVSEGKNDPLYQAHAYPTKVPYKAILNYIAHYTDENDVVLDGFCGTGMTGVAAQLLNRNAVLNDLSPLATFIAHNYNKLLNISDFENEARRILKEVKEECSWLYETRHLESKEESPESLLKIEEKYGHKYIGNINFVVWSDILLCPFCKNEHIFWVEAISHENKKILDTYPCPHCKASLKKKDCSRSTIYYIDKITSQKNKQAKQLPVLISYTVKKGSKNERFLKRPDDDDLKLIQKINEQNIPYWFPINKLPEGYNTAQPIRSHGTTNVHHFFSNRNLWILASFFEKIQKSNVYSIALR